MTSLGSGGGLQRIHAAVLLPPIGILSIVVVSLTGSAFETIFDPEKVLNGNVVSTSLLAYTGPAATLAIAAVIAGAWYATGKAESWVTAASALSTALVAWAFGLLAFGFACKHADVGNTDGKLSGSLKGLVGVTIILVLVETLYVILLHLIVAGRAKD